MIILSDKISRVTWQTIVYTDTYCVVPVSGSDLVPKFPFGFRSSFLPILTGLIPRKTGFSGRLEAPSAYIGCKEANSTALVLFPSTLESVGFTLRFAALKSFCRVKFIFISVSLSKFNVYIHTVNVYIKENRKNEGRAQKWSSSSIFSIRQASPVSLLFGKD